MKITARTVVGNGFPTDEGAAFARHLLEVVDEAGVELRDVTVDLRGLPHAMIISAFFNSFLQEVHDRRASALEAARSIAWSPAFDFQRGLIAGWAEEFSPQPHDNLAQA